MATEVEKLAAFVEKARFEELSKKTIAELKIRILDSLGCAIGAVGAEVPVRLARYLDTMGGNPLVTLIGGGKTSPDRAAFYNGALVRYLDFNDSFLAKNETCHPSDNLAAVLAAAEFAKGSGKELLLALAIAYEVQCRLSEVAPVRPKGFDHTVQGSYGAAAGAAKALGLDAAKIASAIAISATAHNALRVTRTGALSHWKGLAFPETAFCAVHSTFLAREGITGPMEVFEGNKGFMDSIAGKFTISWQEGRLDSVEKTIIKKYNAEIHSQTSIEALLELKHKHRFKPSDIEKIEIDIFDVAFHIIGGGVEGNKKIVRIKEEADHSLPYMVSVGLLDDEVTPRQYHPDRIVKKDVQELLQRIEIRPSDELTARFPKEMRTRIKCTLKNGEILTIEKSDYEGFLTQPMSFETAFNKFKLLAKGKIDDKRQNAIREAVEKIDELKVQDLTSILAGDIK